jgi:large subunit ribosomal protein L22
MATRSKEKTAKRLAEKDTRPTACAKYIRISPTKVRVVIDTVRGKMVNEALAMLKATPKAASTIVYKVIASATANAEHNNNLSRDDLYVAEIFADGGPILKRVNPVSKGRAYRINKRTSHITVILDTKEVK